MSAFPTLPWTYKSRERWLDRRKLTRGTDGTARLRVFAPAKTKAFDLDFFLLEGADKDALEAHYDAHRAASFDFVWRDGATYVVAYGERDIELDLEKVTRWSGKLTLEAI